MTILIDNYHDFLNKEILSLRSYLPSSKLLSFSLRIKDDNGKESQNILAFCSLKENNLLPEGVGCQILEFNNCDFRADEKFFDYLHTRVLMWDNIGNRRFDYIWFSVNEITEDKAISIMEYIKGFEFNDEYAVYIKRIEQDRMNSL